MKVAVLGTGAYGVALAKVLKENGNKVSMWTKFIDEADMLIDKRENIALLKGIKIDEEIYITSDLRLAVKGAKVILMVVPSVAIRETSALLKECMEKDAIICIMSKGIERETYKFLSQVVYEETESSHIAVMSGPTFAREVAENKKIGYTLAGNDNDIEIVKKAIDNKNINIGVTDDILGIQICSSLKNTFAIIMGMVDDESDSTRAAMFTTLLQDLRYLIELLGGRSITIFTFAGIGDFMLTNINKQSRNYTFGTKIKEGKKIHEAMEEMGVKTVEGLYTLDAIKDALEKKHIRITSINTLYDILYNEKDKKELLNIIKW